jgi:Flp pilus assembly protein TadG
MKKEKLILSFIATLFGLLVAGIVFYFFQTAKTTSNNATTTVSIASPTPTITPSISLIVDQPVDEEVVDNKVLTVSGKTQSNAVVTVITDSSNDVVTPDASGNFSTAVNLDDGQNILEVISIAPNGESMTIKKTVTYSQEDF